MAKATTFKEEAVRTHNYGTGDPWLDNSPHEKDFGTVNSTLEFVPVV